MARNPEVTVSVYYAQGTGRGDRVFEWKSTLFHAEKLGRDVVDGLVERGWDAEMRIVRESDEVYPPKPEVP